MPISSPCRIFVFHILHILWVGLLSIPIGKMWLSVKYLLMQISFICFILKPFTFPKNPRVVRTTAFLIQPIRPLSCQLCHCKTKRTQYLRWLRTLGWTSYPPSTINLAFRVHTWARTCRQQDLVHGEHAVLSRPLDWFLHSQAPWRPHPRDAASGINHF